MSERIRPRDAVVEARKEIEDLKKQLAKEKRKVEWMKIYWKVTAQSHVQTAFPLIALAGAYADSLVEDSLEEFEKDIAATSNKF